MWDVSLSARATPRVAVHDLSGDGRSRYGAAVPRSARLRPSLVSAGGLVAGFTVARRTGRRQAGGAVFAAAGAWSARRWWKTVGAGPALGLSALYVAAMGGSHPLARRIGAWPSVGAVSALVVAASELASRRRPAAR